jgi:osmotically inducible protein OsmC
MTIYQETLALAGSTEKVMKVLYTAKTHTSGGRRGGASRGDGRLDVTFSAPGVPGTGTNPEQLFAAGWSACFISAMGLVANKMKVKLPADAAVDAEIDLCNSGDVYFLQARLNVSLPGLERGVAQAIVDATHETTCAYSNATRGNIDVTLSLA